MDRVSDFTNRLSKNYRQRCKWLKKNPTEAYRLYDRDIPEFPYIVDIYGSEAILYDKSKVHAQDLSAPTDSDFWLLTDAIHTAAGDSIKQVHIKKRQRMRGVDQYEKLATKGRFFPVREGNSVFLVNLEDYLDTGLFLDHRPLRERLSKLAGSGQRFLNLFSYTGSVSVAAALAGFQTTSVDLSNTYLSWAERNFRANQLDPKNHQFIREDSLAFLSSTPQKVFDLIFIDPPTFSNSKRLENTFDVKRDHSALIRLGMGWLKESGLLIFSCNKRGFRLDEAIGQTYRVQDISKQSIPADFRDQKIHVCYEIRKNS